MNYHSTSIQRNADLRFTRSFKDFGEIDIRPFRISEDSEFLHQWIIQEYAVFWGMQGYTLSQVRKEYARLMSPDHYEIFTGLYKGQPVFVLERYDPRQDVVGEYYRVAEGDCGIHIIVAPPLRPIPNFTWYVFAALLEFIYQNEAIQRILVEPDIRNKKMFALCERMGFRLDTIIELPHKTAQLAFLDKAVFQQKTNAAILNKRSAMNTLDNTVSPQQSVQHLRSQTWEKANRLLVRKAISEFSHELLLRPKIIEKLTGGWNTYELTADTASITYTFRAKPMMMHHFRIDIESIVKQRESKPQSLDAVLFIKEFRNALGIDDQKMPLYLEEIISTLAGSAYKLEKEKLSSEELVDADFQTIEQSMAEGHPGFVANNGRIGFDSSDYQSYAPEAGNSFSLLWLAGHKSKTVYAALDTLPYDLLIREELDTNTLTTFREHIRNKGLDPDDYYFIPVHPWQWFNKLATICAPEIAANDLICLGYGPDQYVAQQSVRTLFNLTNPTKMYTKTALSILNMGFMRGLPLYYLGTAPKMAIWLADLLYEDPYIRETGFRMLGEIASVSYVNPYFEEFGVHNDYNKMLASLWRESPVHAVDKNQKLMTMAAFLHIDAKGEALLPKIIERSELSIDGWLRQYLKAYLSPLLHCFYTYDLVFMPHGENIIMVLENHIPVKIFLKDITEEACILNPDVELPDHLKRMYAPVPEDVKLLSVFTDIFDGFFRFMAQILDEHVDYPETQFWATVAENIRDYQEQFPQLNAKFVQYDLFASEFHLSCLNRLQLRNHKQMIDLDDPVALLQFAGKLQNPIAAYRPEHAETVSS